MDIESILMLCLYIFMIAAGYAAGRRLKKKQKSIKCVQHLQTAAIIMIVFIMGVRIGMNKDIASSFGTIGLMSLVFTLAVMAGSVAAVYLSRRFLGLDRKGRRADD